MGMEINELIERLAVAETVGGNMFPLLLLKRKKSRLLNYKFYFGPLPTYETESYNLFARIDS
jgi:hypothetical protein